MAGVSEVISVSITLSADDNNLLFIMLSADGVIKRSGSGTLDNTEHEVYSGSNAAQIFTDLMTYIDDYTLDFLGEYKMPGQKGLPCRLSVLFKFSDMSDGAFVFTYGSESPGPPKAVTEFKDAAVKLTNKWYKEQKKLNSHKRDRIVEES